MKFRIATFWKTLPKRELRKAESLLCATLILGTITLSSIAWLYKPVQALPVVSMERRYNDLRVYDKPIKKIHPAPTVPCYVDGELFIYDTVSYVSAKNVWQQVTE